MFKVALVTTPPSVRSGIGDYTRHLLPYLRENCAVELFVEPRFEKEDWPGERQRSAERLDPREFDQVLYQIGNESHHAFMVPMIRTIGGTVMQHDWVLYDLACAAFPALVHGGWKGHISALREGGLAQGRIYAANFLARRAQRTRPEPTVEHEGLSGTVLGGWHAEEPTGRWTADCAVFRVPAKGVRAVLVTLFTHAGRHVTLAEAGTSASVTVDANDAAHETELCLELQGSDEPVLRLMTDGISVTDEQRAHGDIRRLGSFVQAVRWRDAEGEHELDLSVPPRVPIQPIDLARDRFRLPLGRSVVRMADSFIVHSEYVRQRILRERNSLTPIGVLPHGSERRWRDGDRRDTRAELGLPAAWRDDFLVVSFGGVQPHKRIDKLLEGVAAARKQREGVRCVIAGKWNSAEMDPPALAAALGISDSVHFAGFVEESYAWDLIHAGDICVNLRGPTSGGTSGGIFQSFSLGRSVIATDAAEQSELPDSCVLKVPLGEGEVDHLAKVLVDLHDDPARRVQLEESVRRYVWDTCHWGVVGRSYAEFLQAFPGPRSTRKSVIAMRMGMATSRRAAV